MKEDATGEPGTAASETSAEADTAGHTSGPPVVGIGVSTGGIDALLDLLPVILPDCGMAFVVVQHLDPERASALTAVLGRSCAVPVMQIENNMPVAPGKVYVVPPNGCATIENGHLHLHSPAPADTRFGCIDAFFLSLARDQGENAACVILSGTGSGGMIGLRAIKESGGLTIAQSDGAYDGMMRTAVGTGMVDFVLPAEQVVGKLAQYFSFARKTRNDMRQEQYENETAEQLSAIIAIVRNKTGNDFSGYKDRTIIRRVQRRMHVLQITELKRFIQRLRDEPNEITLLFQDLLIGVTEFFRDPEAFQVLNELVIPELFKNKAPDDTIRIWVPGCSTGEEVYSIAILLREYSRKLPAPPKLQIFATDIDEQALEIARTGRYPATVGPAMPPEYLTRYFIREDGTYRVTSDLREICLFSLHNLLRDAPFSKQDLISCRNLLIYFSADLQSHVIPLFHYALNPNGFLFLGPSENVTRHARLFSTIDKSLRIFQHRANIDRRLPEFPLSVPQPGRRDRTPRALRAAAEPNLRAVAERQLLERFLPPYVIVNADGDLVQSSGRTGKYLELPAGAPDTNLFSMARPGLRLELRAALHMAVASGKGSVQRRVPVDTSGGRQEIELHVQPLRFGSPPEMFYLVIFQDIGAVQPDGAALVAEPDQDIVDVTVRQIEADLLATRERLQATTDELESSNEELRSNNEELSSMNEELQSANEELETSKEELQSINEELHTVNAELNSRVEELTRANNDMSNLLNSTQIATVFLDRSLLLNGFTPAAKDVFRLVESDVGRPIMHVRPRVILENLQEDAERVLRTLSTIERPVKSNENDTLYMMRLLPYRTVDNVISGVVMTFNDVTRVAEAEARIKKLTSDLRARIQELETVIHLVPIGVLIAEGVEPDRVLTNQSGARLLGYPDGRTGLDQVSRELHLEDANGVMPVAETPLYHALRRGEPVPLIEGRLRREDGQTVAVMMSASPLFDERHAVRGAVGAIVDITAQKEAESRQRMLLDELQHRVKNTLATVSSLASRMSRRARSVSQFQDAFLSRLAAMGRTHDLLSAGAWEGADLRSLISVALDSFASLEKTNVNASGPSVTLKPNTASTLGMVFHELATNAAKYGALSVDGGSVNVAWSLRDGAGRDGAGSEQWLEIDWVEHDGPHVDTALSEGFGTGFVRRSVEYEMEGSAELRLLPEGLQCKISIPRDGNVE